MEETKQVHETIEETPILEVRHLKQYFRFNGATGPNKYLKAVHDVNFKVKRGEVFGLVGESGCGKTTTGRDIMHLYDVTSGDIWMDGVRVAAGTRWNEKEIKYTLIRANKEIRALEAEKKSLSKGDSRIEEINSQIADIKKKAETVSAIQKEKIRQAKDDNKHYNRNIALAEVAKVKIAHKALLSKIEQSSIHDLNEEELEEYRVYEAELKKAKATSIANKVQMIFQDPIASLNPRMTVRNIIAEGLIIQGVKDKEFINSEVARVLQLVGLVPEHANRYPHEFSGGQRQRIGIARALIMNPEIIVADEPVSALDVSVQAQVINLLNELRHKFGLTIIFIAHNLSVVKYFCDRIAVMYFGNLVELAPSEELFAHPLHPYTKSLLSAVPHPDPIIEATRTRIVYDPMSAHDYSSDKPSYREIAPGHFVRANDAEFAAYQEELKK